MSVYIDRLSPHQDDIYEALMAAHECLTTDQSHALNARLVLLLANQIGDREAVLDLLRTARGYQDR